MKNIIAILVNIKSVSRLLACLISAKAHQLAGDFEFQWHKVTKSTLVLDQIPIFPEVQFSQILKPHNSTHFIYHESITITTWSLVSHLV